MDRIQQWSQGDCVLGALPILWGFDKECPLTDTTREQAEDSEPILGVSIGGDEVAGLVVISQTCDIVRRASERPFVQVAPLVERSEEEMELIRLRMKPRFGFLPTLAERRLVADLDRVLTIEKAFLAKWERIPAFRDEIQRLSFTETIRRYYNRPAIPEPFVNAVRKLSAWFHEKHDRVPDPPRKGPVVPFHPGACLRALAMLLVRVNPSWDAPAFHVDFILVRKSDEDGIPASAWEEFKGACQAKVMLPSSMTSRWEDVSLDALPAKLYLECNILDLDYLSDGTRRRP